MPNITYVQYIPISHVMFTCWPTVQYQMWIENSIVRFVIVHFVHIFFASSVCAFPPPGPWDVWPWVRCGCTGSHVQPERGVGPSAVPLLRQDGHPHLQPDALQEVLHPRHSVWVSGNRRVRNSFVCLFILLIPSSVSSPVGLSTHIHICPTIHPFVCLLGRRLFVCVFVHLFLCLFTFLFLCLFVCRSVDSFVRCWAQQDRQSLSLHALLNNGYIHIS